MDLPIADLSNLPEEVVTRHNKARCTMPRATPPRLADSRAVLHMPLMDGRRQRAVLRGGRGVLAHASCTPRSHPVRATDRPAGARVEAGAHPTRGARDADLVGARGAHDGQADGDAARRSRAARLVGDPRGRQLLLGDRVLRWGHLAAARPLARDDQRPFAAHGVGEDCRRLATPVPVGAPADTPRSLPRARPARAVARAHTRASTPTPHRRRADACLASAACATPCRPWHAQGEWQQRSQTLGEQLTPLIFPLAEADGRSVDEDGRAPTSPTAASATASSDDDEGLSAYEKARNRQILVRSPHARRPSR